MITPEKAKELAVEFRRFGRLVEEIMPTLDTTSYPCDCCGVVKYNNWQQNQLWIKLEGLVDRVETAGSLLAKGANNPEFLGIVKEMAYVVGNDPNTGHQR